MVWGLIHQGICFVKPATIGLAHSPGQCRNEPSGRPKKFLPLLRENSGSWARRLSASRAYRPVCREPTPATLRPQGHALSRLTRVRVTNRGLLAHGWSRRLGDYSISLGQKMKELIGTPTRCCCDTADLKTQISDSQPHSTRGRPAVCLFPPGRSALIAIFNEPRS